MNQFRSRCLITLTLLAFIIAPASALYTLRDVHVTPPAESLPSGTLVNSTAMIELIPPGPTTTFVEWDDLILSTELLEPRWDVVVLVDDRQVAVNPEEGPIVKVPGYLLSYPVNKHVAVRVHLDGVVPPSQDQQPFTLLMVEEQNDIGKKVGDTDEKVTRIVAASATPPQPLSTTQGTLQPPTTPTKAGVSIVPFIAALLAIAAVLGRTKN